MSMTYSLCPEVADLLSPRRFYSPTQILNNPKVVPDAPGVYGWWLDSGLRGVPTSESETIDNRWLLYVGIARSRASSPDRPARRTLRDRLKNHCRGPIATSTFRYTLCALLKEQLNLTSYREGRKLRLPLDQEITLTNWMADHAVAAWVENSKPWELEDFLIKSGPRLPLNIMGSTDPFRIKLTELRRALRT